MKYLLFVLPLLFSFCQSEKPTQTVGGGTDTEHSFTRKVIGRLLYEDSTLASYTEINMVSNSFTPSLGDTDSAILTVYTDSQGVYTILPKAVGVYNLSSIKDDQGVFIDSVPVTDDSSDILLGDSYLKCNGSIKGALCMVGISSDNQVKADIYIPGSIFFTRPSLGGSFTLFNIPSGDYQLLVVPLYDNYNVKVLDVSVPMCGTLDLDTIYIAQSNGYAPPVASFEVLPDTGYVSTVYIFDASSCSDPNMSMLYLKVQWDWDGDWVWDTNWGDASVALTHSYNEPGRKTINMRVTNLNGKMDTCSRQILVNPVPKMEASNSSIYVYCDEGQDANNTQIEVWNSGSGILNYSIAVDQPWLSCNSLSGSSAGEHDIITLDFNTSELLEGDYSASIEMRYNGIEDSLLTIDVNLKVYSLLGVLVDSVVFNSGTQLLGFRHGGGYLWISDDNGFKIRKTDIVTGAFIDSFDQEDIDPGNTSAHGIAYDDIDNCLYYFVYPYGPINKIDINNGYTKLNSIDTTIAWPNGIEYDGTYLWITEMNTVAGRYYIHRCNASTGEIINSINVPHDLRSGAGLAYTDGCLWFSSGAQKRYYKIDISRAIIDGHCENALVDSFDCVKTGFLSWDGQYLWVKGDDRIYKLRPY